MMPQSTVTSRFVPTSISSVAGQHSPDPSMAHSGSYRTHAIKVFRFYGYPDLLVIKFYHTTPRNPSTF